MKIAVVGIGYVGLSNAILLAQHNEVTAVDIVKEKVNLINNRKSPISDKEIEDYLADKSLNLKAVVNGEEAYREADIIIVAVPTNYDPDKNYFDTSAVESVLRNIDEIGTKATIIIKSTIPIGYTEKINQKYRSLSILFSPEFLREGKALYDNLYPSRIIVGIPGKEKNLKHKAELFIKLIKEAAIKTEIPVLVTGSNEAESIKLFSNTFLAIRVAYFNEIDTYAEEKGLSTEDIIRGVSYDPRIGDFYNNPSFGYGGYCLPKDTKQLLANFEGIPEKMIRAAVEANIDRIRYIADKICQKKPKLVGIYRLTMKKESDNFRSSAIQGVISVLKERGVKLLIYEPLLEQREFDGIPVTEDLNELKENCDLVIANRWNKELYDIVEKVYIRDLFKRD